MRKLSLRFSDLVNATQLSVPQPSTHCNILTWLIQQPCDFVAPLQIKTEDGQFAVQLIKQGKGMDVLKPVTFLGSTPKTPERDATSPALSWSFLQIKY